MSIKNQKTLLISASGIIALTVVGLFGLNFLVDRISKISPPSVVITKPVETPRAMPGKDDSFLGPESQPPMPPPGFPQSGDDRFPPRRRGEMRNGDRPPMQQEPMRRLRNGKEAPDLRRGQQPPPPGARDDTLDNGQKMRPPMPPQMGGYPPPMDPSKMSPRERQQFQEEMQRYQEMYYGSPNGAPNGQPNGAPPGYYPPPPQNYDYYDEYDSGPEPPQYDFDYDYEDYYDGGSGSNHHDPEKEIEKTAGIIEEIYEDDEYDPDYEDIDDYLNEYED